MPGMLTSHVPKACFTVLACLLLAVLCIRPLSAGEPDPQPTTAPTTAPQPAAPQQPQAEQKSTKTKLEPRDLLPSMLHTKPGTGSAATAESLLSRDRTDLRRLQRDNTRVNRKMQQLDYTIRKMQSDINRAQRIRRQRY